MLRPQIVVFERERRIAPLLHDLAAAERWVLREPKQREPGWEFLRQDAPTVCVIRVPDTDSDDAFQLLVSVVQSCPAAAVVAVGDVQNAEARAGLAWDLGADFSLFPPLSRDLLPEIVRGLMQRCQRAKENPPVSTGGL